MQTRSSKSATSSEGDKTRTRNNKSFFPWELGEEAALIEFLSGRKEAMTSNHMFKSGVFQDVANLVNSKFKKMRTKDTCRTKWQRVCISLVCVLPVS